MNKIKDLFHNTPASTLDDSQIEQLLQKSWNQCREYGDKNMESFLRHVYYDMHSALFKITVTGELPEGVSQPSTTSTSAASETDTAYSRGTEEQKFNLNDYMDSPEFGSYMGELGKWCSQQHNYHFQPPVIDGDECQIEIEDSMGITICTVIIDSEGNTRVDYTGGFGSSADRPPLPDIKR